MMRMMRMMMVFLIMVIKRRTVVMMVMECRCDVHSSMHALLVLHDINTNVNPYAQAYMRTCTHDRRGLRRWREIKTV